MTELKTKVTASDREIVITRVINAPRERVWEAMTDPKQVVKWWGPIGFTNTTHIHDFRVGGRWEHTMHGPDGTDYPNKSVFKEIIKYERIVYVHGGGKAGEPAAGFEASWIFEALGDKTRLTGRMAFPSKEARETVVKTYKAIEGGHQNMDRLVDYLGVKPPFELVLERVIQAPRDLVYDAWTQPDQIKHWFAPKPFQLVVKQMDFRPGGKFSMAMQGPDGQHFPFTGVYGVIIPPVLLSWNGEFATGPAGQMSTMVSFEEEDGGTKLRVRQSFFTMTPEIEQATKGAKQGWGMTLDQLTDYLNKGGR